MCYFAMAEICAAYHALCWFLCMQSRCTYTYILTIYLKLPAFAAVRTLDDVTLISEATARAIHRLKREEDSEQEETISCTASSTPFVKVMMRPALSHAYLIIWVAFVDKVCQRNFVGPELLPSIVHHGMYTSDVYQ